jgi:uncharacterized protein (DUF433 family)
LFAQRGSGAGTGGESAEEESGVGAFGFSGEERAIDVQPGVTGPSGTGPTIRSFRGSAAPATRYDLGVSRMNRITTDPAVCHGKPTIRGLRYPVENLLELLASGMTIEEILEDYPDLEHEDLLAALEFAVLASANRRVVPLDAA